ncbi:MAG TPA: oligosaccharide flippase family protein, partial [Spirochaetota bacterium]|nr:oligosaccharide flippase family protein [Spirochaetota bacterium]
MVTSKADHGKTFAKNSAIMLTRRVVDILIGFVTIFFIARILGKEGQGAYSLIILLPTMLDSFLNLGISPATIYYTAKRKTEIAEIIRIDILFSVLLSLAGIVIGGVILYFLSDRFFKGIPLMLLAMGLAGLPAKMGFTFLGNVFLGIQDYKTYNFVMIANRLLFLGILLVLYVFSPVVKSNVIAFVSADVLSLLMVLILVIRRFNPFKDTSITEYNVKPILKYGFKSYINNLLGFLNYRIDMFLVSFFLGNAAVGLYSIA